MNRKEIHAALKLLERDLKDMQLQFGSYAPRGGGVAAAKAAGCLQGFRFRVENLALEVQGPPTPPKKKVEETDLFKETAKA